LESPRILFKIDDDQSTSAIAVGDVTGSGLSELCTGGRDGVLRLYDANRQEVQFLAQCEVTGAILSIKIADANNDGLMEIVVGRSVGPEDMPGVAGTVQVYRYAPSGIIELLSEYPVDRFVTTVVVTDVTGDDKNEILVGGSDSTLRVIKMDTENQMTEFIRHQLEDMPIAIGTCDVIGDEIDEIVTGNRDKTLHVFKVKNQSVEQIEVIELPSPIISIAAGDILGDRKMELGVVTYDGAIRVYRNEESKLDLFSTLEGINALSVRIEELNADHMDEMVIATSDHKIVFYNLYMAELNKIAERDIGAKILSISVGDAGGDDRKEVLVGTSNGPLQVIEGLYQVIPKFEVSAEAKTGTNLKGILTLTNVTDQPVTGITGKLYWFPKANMDVNPQQIRFDLGPNETKAVEVQLMPKEEGTVIVRPIVLMWTDSRGQVKQVTTPETAVLVERGSAIAAPASEAPVTHIESDVTDYDVVPEPSPFAPVSETGFGVVEKTDTPGIGATAVMEDSEESLKAAEDLLDKLFGTEVEGTPELEEIDDIDALAAEAVAEVTPEPEPPPVEVVAESALITEIRARAPKPPRPGTSAESYAYLFKVMITGEGAVGKTALVNRYTTGQFSTDYKTTIGSQFAVKLAHISPAESEYAIGIKVQAWDVAGQARFKAVRKMYYSGGAGVILVFDVTRRRSFAELSKWVQEADESIGQRVRFIVVGNKIDLPDRAVPSEEAKRWAEDQGFLYMESSAKTGEGVADMFTVLSDLMYREARKSIEAKKSGA
jgi:small GTP-binding protein